MRFPHADRSPIGIDIGRTAIGAVQVSSRGERCRVEAAAVLDRPPAADTGVTLPTPDEAGRLCDVLYRQGFTGRRITLAVPDHRLLTAILELPPRESGAPIEQLAKVELSRVHKREPGSLEMACWDIPAPARPGDGSHIMAAACAHEDAGPLLDIFESAGLTVVALDSRPWAMTRACRSLLSSAQNVSAILDLGEAGALLTIIRTGVVVYERPMPEAGIGALRARLCAELHTLPDVADYALAALSSAPGSAPQDDTQTLKGAGAIVDEHTDSLIVEVRSALDYALHRYPGGVDHLLLAGPGTQLANLAARVSAALSVTATVVCPAALAECPEALLGPCSNPALTTALGLATWSQRRAA